LALMQSQYPDSRYTRIMLDPNAAIDDTGSAVAAYESIYNMYRQGDFVETLNVLEETIPNLFNDNIISKYELLKATSLRRLNVLDDYQNAVEQVAMTYQTTGEGKERQRILTEEIPRLTNLTISYDLSSNLKMLYVVSYSFPKEDE